VSCGKPQPSPWLGTRFLLAKEAPVHPEYRRRIAAPSETDADWYRDLYDVEWRDAPRRALCNQTAAVWEAAGCQPPGARPGEGETIAYEGGRPIVRYSASRALTRTG
jgi:hypothetical protein